MEETIKLLKELLEEYDTVTSSPYYQGDCDYDLIDKVKAQIQAFDLADVSNFVLLAKHNYKAKDGTIKRGIEIDGKFYAPQNDC